MRAWTLPFAVAWSLFTGWTIVRLWRRATDRYTQLVYTYGVKAFGLGMYVLSTLGYASQGASTRRLIIQILVDLPLSLWAGYAFGRSMAWFLGVRRDDRAV
jgi:hypothetical protein